MHSIFFNIFETILANYIYLPSVASSYWDWDIVSPLIVSKVNSPVSIFQVPFEKILLPFKTWAGFNVLSIILRYLSLYSLLLSSIYFNKFIVIKDTKNGPQLAWVKIGISDLSNVEIIEGLSTGETVYILPSKSLVDYQRQFRERVEASFSFG